MSMDGKGHRDEENCRTQKFCMQVEVCHLANPVLRLRLKKPFGSHRKSLAEAGQLFQKNNKSQDMISLCSLLTQQLICVSY